MGSDQSSDYLPELEKKETSGAPQLQSWIGKNQSQISNQTPSRIHSQTSPIKTQPVNKIQELRCMSNYLIVNMCTNHSCQGDALYCDQKTCPCLTLHQKCTNMKLNVVTTFLQKRADQQKRFLENMHQIEEKTLSACQKARKTVVEGFFLRGFQEKYLDIVNAIFFGEVKSKFTGKTVDSFIWKLRESNSELNKVGQNCLNEIEREVQRVTAALVKLEDKIIKQYLNHIRITDQMIIHQKEIPLPILDSELVTNKEQIKFIYQSLGKPKQFKKIFKASENQYKASRFHALCDHVPHTLTLVKTEFDKIVGGYNPLTWNFSKGFVTDHTNLSCLLLVDSQIKASLVKPNKAIQCFENYGPVFGGGSDLAISDECDKNQKSMTSFPYSYNLDKDPLKFDQSSWTMICGAPNGKNFQVKDYEVFKIIW